MVQRVPILPAAGSLIVNILCYYVTFIKTKELILIHYYLLVFNFL